MDGNPIRVAVAGGGIAGLALAVGLARKPHVDVRVYEAAAAYRDVGAGLALHLNAIRAMGLVGAGLRQAYLRKALHMAGDADRVMATEVVLAQGPHSGQLVAELGRARGRKTVSRADLLDGFLELLPRDRISFGKRLVGVEERPAGGGNGNGNGNGDDGSVLLTFQDGTRASADCLLGADGIHSFARRYLLGADHPATAPKNHDGWQIYRVMVSAEEARRQINPKWTENVPILLGPRGHINCIPLNKGTRLSAGVAVRRGSEWAATTVRSPKDEPEPEPADSNGNDNDNNNDEPTSGNHGRRPQPPPLDPDLYADYSEEAQQIVRMVAKGDTSASWTLADHDHAPYYARRGSAVAVLGDAAHAALPFVGNGAAQALEDAAVLDCLFGAIAGDQRLLGPGPGRRKAIEDALLAYDHVRRPRTQAVVDIARKFGRIYAYAEDGMHEDPPRLRAFFAEMAAFMNDFDVQGQNEAALERFRILQEATIDGMGDL